jgi:hypothetical protein
MMRILDILMKFALISLASGKALDNVCLSDSSNGVSLLSLAIHKDPGSASEFPKTGIFGTKDSEMQKRDSAGHCRGFRTDSDGVPTLRPLAKQRGAKFLLEADATTAKCAEACLSDSECRFFSLWSGGDGGPTRAACASFKYCKESKRQASAEFQTWKKRTTKSNTEENATPSPTEAAEVTPAPTPPTEAEDETYYSSEASYYSSEEEQVTPAPTPPPTSPGMYDSTGCFSSMRPRETTVENPCVDAGHYDITDPALCVDAIIEENTRRGSQSPSNGGAINEDAMRNAVNWVDWGFRPYGCLTKQIGNTQVFKLNKNVDGFLDYHGPHPESYITYCCIPSEGCPCGEEEETEAGEETYYSSEASYYSSEEEQVTPAPTPPTEAEEDAYYSSESYYGSEASYYSSEEEQVTPAPTPPPTEAEEETYYSSYYYSSED